MQLTPPLVWPAAWLLVADAILLLAFTLGVVVDPTIAGWDATIGTAFAPWRAGAPLAALLWVTALGTGATLTAVMVTATALAWAWRSVWLVVPCWVAFLGAEATTWTLKYAIGRHRPEFVTVATASSPSFPSAHATGSAVVYGCLAWLVCQALPGQPTRRAVAAVAGAVVLAVGLSRVALSVHYASDVAAGILVGLFWVLLLPTVQRAVRSSPQLRQPPPSSR